MKSSRASARGAALWSHWFVAPLFAGAVACGGEDAGRGTVLFTTYGEDFIEREIPSDEFDDGWSVRYSTFLIVLGDVTVADASGGSVARLKGTWLFDLVEPGPHELGELSLPAGSWERVGYEMPLAASDTRRGPGVSDGDLGLMRDGPFAVYAAGTASRDEEAKSFAWGFDAATRFDSCEAEVDGRAVPGFSLGRNAEETVELTIHGDHLFYDDLVSSDAVLRFDSIAAADADADGEVTLDELGAVELLDVTDGPYGTGSYSDVDDLGAYVRALTTTLGHFRGEGHCVPERSEGS